ncbi:cytoplasmic dynein 2 intermediate chain 2 isoform X1 [Tribolium castaneum]|uniref:cytoplasmic dynein 2 intermediate chain 2 isoform X1 n=2 Tax=Tribolium castaneum TaxID=7070 RepID=UPI00046C0DA6
MFNVKHNECVGFESRWRVKKVSSVGSTQTTDYSKAEMETSPPEKKDTQVQTETPEGATSVQVDEEKLAEWLRKIYPKVKKELDDSANSRAFKGYKLSTDSSDANCKLVQILNVASQVKDAEIGSYVSAMSWNSTNQTLAVSCTYKHNSWCYHEGVVAIYTLDREDNLPETPRVKLTTESCVTELRFHSVLPAIIAAGLFSGGIIIWNIQKEDDQVVAKVEGHGDGITQLSWIIDINSAKNVLLASSGLDGLLSIWNFSLNESALTIKERHQIRSQLMPKNSESQEETVKKIARGVTCFDFSKYSPEIFVIGGEGGLVVQCSLLGSRKLQGSKDEAPLLDSVFKYYEGHKGEVSSIKFSPNRREMFMTSGSDSEIRIYVVDQEEPAQVIFLKQPLLDVSWVPYEERIICGCGKNGVIEIYNLLKGKAIENTTKEKIKSEIMTQVEINKTKSNIVAVGTESGHVQMWRVPWALFGNLSL